MKQVTPEPLGDLQFVFPPTFRPCSVRETGFAISSAIHEDGSHYFGAGTSGKTKVYCNRCFESHLSQLRAPDEAAIASGTLVERRSDSILHDLCKD